MEIDFETWKQLVEGAKIITAKLVQPNSLYMEFDTGMACYVAADRSLEFDFNWLEGFESLVKPALKIYMESMLKRKKTLERKCKNCQFCIPTKRGPFICGLGANEFIDIYVDDKGEEHLVAGEIVQPEQDCKYPPSDEYISFTSIQVKDQTWGKEDKSRDEG